MAVSRLRVRNLRILESLAIELDARCNYVVGPNASGKTSLLEALHLLGRARSFRTRQNRRLVRHGSAGFSVYGETRRDGRAHRLGVAFSESRLRVRIDDRDAVGSSALTEHLGVHVIEPGIHGLVDGGPTIRRRFVDWGVFHVEHDYLEAWRRYRRVLGQRNAALKASIGAPVDVWREALIAAAGQITDAREGYVRALAPRVEAYGEALMDQAIELRYRPGWAAEETFAEALERSFERDRRHGATQVGPHRADLAVTGASGRVRDEASRGQQKLIAAALVLAQAAHYAEARPDHGLLLVDDPAAELDQGARERLLAVVAEVPGQRIVTGLTRGALAPLGASRVFHVEQGRVKAVYNIPV